jgi:two-component system, OmpR family, phosphate regulon sensor histidine kinase PhoR
VRRRTIIIIISLAIVSLSCIVAGQFYWVRKAYELEETKFNNNVKESLNGVVSKILEINRDSSTTKGVKQKANAFFAANINDTPPPFLLETLLKEQFKKHNIHDTFEYGIYDCFYDSILYAKRVSYEGDNPNAPLLITSQAEFDADGHYIALFFPYKTKAILSHLTFWVYSSVIIILIIIFFTYVINLLLQQKKHSEVKADFINNMTHELRTPISTIGLSAEALSNPNVLSNAERLKGYVTIIRNENDRLKSQVDRVLQIATLDPKKVNFKLEQLSVNEIIQRAVQTFHVRIDERGGQLDLKLDATKDRIVGDRLHFTNVIYNLLDNATKYSKDEPHINIETVNDGGNIVIKVKDNGIGIGKQHLSNIFDKFYRVPTGNIHDVRGFGLGLFYVKTVVLAHKGKIKVESEPGEGSTFIIILNFQ